MPKTPLDENLDVDGAHTLAGAICWFAGAEWAESLEHHEQIAATMYHLASTGFNGVSPNKAVEAFVAEMLERAKKAK